MNIEKELDLLVKNNGYDSFLEITQLAALQKLQQISLHKCTSGILMVDLHKFKFSKDSNSSFFSYTFDNSTILFQSSKDLFFLFSYNDGFFSPLNSFSNKYSNLDYSLPSSLHYHKEIIISAEVKNYRKPLFSFIPKSFTAYYILLHDSDYSVKKDSNFSMNKLFYNERQTQAIMKKYLK